MPEKKDDSKKVKIVPHDFTKKFASQQKEIQK